MNPVIVNILTIIVTFVVMECVAWLAHKYLMHGLFWFLHHDHHQRDDQDFFEKNDYFFLIFATPGILCLFFGLEQNFSMLFWIGTGISLYGMAYFLVHDIFIHQRFKIFRNTDSFYLKAIRKAHKVHHKHLQKEEGECFGMLWVSFKYFKEAKQSMAKQNKVQRSV
ncbi:sterol desaturase family protein [Dyadobacter frigoris]|uniref:Beta-carotene hydroxylase n=1 Tax=Dyadobacter frigoris TaxID=2576211 RepID=A0A4U6CY52_9BACT|nr:sterol desaturase family protein [Dyadobacter frigoris]TKT88661.1 beta-carotene hydroxylase [Dyadobacter frigoris]GLU53843.1 beta-carotene hydroxylase [Dyadobacter frigoris]